MTKRGEEFHPRAFLEHNRAINRQFDKTPNQAAYRLEACFVEQLKELGMFGWHVGDEDLYGEPVQRFEYIKPEAIRVVIDAFMSGKLPQPEGSGSILFSERTAIGRQAALDTAIEFVKAAPKYDITTDPDFSSDQGGASA